CDDDTLRLTRAIIAAARGGRPVFMLRRLVGSDEETRVAATLFDVCNARLSTEERAYLGGESNIFLGWMAFDRHERRGYAEAIRPWQFAYAAHGSPLVPSLPLLLAVWRYDPTALSRMEQGNFLVRPREVVGSKYEPEVRTCPPPDPRCAYA